MMNRFSFVLMAGFLAAPAWAEEKRQLDAHEHGVGQLNIAFDGLSVAMELRAPGADIVGFEHAAERAEDRALVGAAVATLARPLELFAVPAAAECSVVQASAELEGEEAHADKKDDHDHKHDDDKHVDEAGHTEFHAEYVLNCADVSAVNEVTFNYFQAFPNAQELEVQVITASGASAFEVKRQSPSLDLRGMF